MTRREDVTIIGGTTVLLLVVFVIQTLFGAIHPESVSVVDRVIVVVLMGLGLAAFFLHLVDDTEDEAQGEDHSQCHSHLHSH
jgi:hypothetical protein